VIEINMRRILPLLIVVLSSSAVLADTDWPPRADAAFLADVYPSRDLALRAVSAQLGDDAKIVESNNQITATRTNGEGHRELSVAFVEKPWAADWSAFTNSTKGAMLLARSTSPCTSASEAETDAKRSAIAELLPIVRDPITHTYSGRRVLSDKILSDMIARSLESRGMMSDRFVQRFSRPYGDVWYEAIVVDASPRNIDAIVARASHLAERRIQRGVGIVLAFLLLLGITTLAYVLLNWLTKGYFIWRLRFAAMTTIALAAMTALAIA
jgi:hypothetical protein